jgi:hypothetical protein
MKTCVLTIVLALLIGCNHKPIDNTSVLEDSIDILNEKLYYSQKANKELFVMYQNVADSFMIVSDSLDRLNEKPLMTEKQFIEIYKYERLLKYYKICKRNPTQWKFYKGWSIRVFEE